MDEIAKFSPSEIVVNGEFFHDENIKKTLKQRFDVYISGLEDKFLKRSFHTEGKKLF